MRVMSSSSFEARMDRLSESQLVRPANANHPPLRRAENRHEQLALALDHLDRLGVPRDVSYPPLFRALAHVGIILRPMHFWSMSGLILSFVMVFAALSGLLIAAASLLGEKPVLVQVLIGAGPLIFAALAFGLGLVFAMVLKSRSYVRDLPHWRDL